MMHCPEDENAFLLDRSGDHRGREANIAEKIRLAIRGDGLTYRGLVLHGLRNTFAILFEQAGVSEDVNEGIMGHKRTTTYGIFSGGTSINQRFQATDKLQFSAEQNERPPRSMRLATVRMLLYEAHKADYLKT